MMYKELLRKHVGRKCEISQGQNRCGCEIIIQDNGVHEIINVTDEYVMFSEPPLGNKSDTVIHYRYFLVENTSLLTDVRP